MWKIQLYPAVLQKLTPHMAAVHCIIIALLCVQVSFGRDSIFTFKVPPGSRECFFEDISAEGEIDLEYQVSFLLHTLCVCQ